MSAGARSPPSHSFHARRSGGAGAGTQPRAAGPDHGSLPIALGPVLARNHAHATFIEERFNHHCPRYAGVPDIALTRANETMICGVGVFVGQAV